MKLTVRQLKQIIKEQVEEARLTPFKKARARTRYKKLVSLLSQLSKAHPEHYESGGFDYPTYGGLPKSVSNTLSGPEVDMIQDHINFMGKFIPKKLYQELVEGFDTGYMEDWDE